MKYLNIFTFAFIVVGYIYAIRCYCESNYSNIDSATSIFCERIALSQRIDIILKLKPFVKDKYAKESISLSLILSKNYNKSATDIYKLITNASKNNILIEKMLINWGISHIEKSTKVETIKRMGEYWYILQKTKDSPLKAKLQYILAEKLSLPNYYDRAMQIIKQKKWDITYANELLDICKLSIKNNRFQDYLYIIENTPFSFRKSIIYYFPLSTDDAIKNVSKVLKEDLPINSTTKKFFNAINDSHIWSNKHRVKFEHNLIKHGMYTYYGWDWQYWKIYEYNYPIYALASSLLNSQKEKDEYLKKSLSDKTIKKLNALFYNYVHYATIAFCEIDENEHALPFIEKIKSPEKRSKYLKQTIRYLSIDASLHDKLTIELIKIYKTSILDLEHYQ